MELLTINEYIELATAKANGTLSTDKSIVEKYTQDLPVADALYKLVTLVLRSRKRHLTLHHECKCGKKHTLTADWKDVKITKTVRDLTINCPGVALELRYPRIFEDLDYATMIEHCIVRVNGIEWDDTTEEERQSVLDALTFDVLKQIIDLLTEPQCFVAKGGLCDCGERFTAIKSGYNLLEF